MEQKIILSSYRAQGTPSDFTTVFERPLLLEQNKQYSIGLDKINSMTYSWYNISPEYKNNLIKYHNGSEWKDILFDSGSYSYKDINDYIHETLITSGDAEPDSSPIQLEFDLSSFKCLLTINNPFALDLRNSNFGSLIGFEDEFFRQTKWGTKTPNITNSVDNLYVHCDIASNSIVDGGYGDVIFVISTADLRRSYPFAVEPLRVGYCEMNKTVINSIRIHITDPTGKLVNINSVDTSFTLVLKEV